MNLGELLNKNRANIDALLLDKALKITSARGLSGAGATLDFLGNLTGHFRDLVPKGMMLTVEPGDLFRSGHSNTPDVQISAPIAIDVWYLWRTTNILPADKTESDTYISERLAFLTTKLGGVKPLRTVVRRSDIAHYDETWATKEYFENTGPHYIKQMRFETRLFDESFITDSAHKPAGNLYAYLAFPVGQLGVMKVVSVFGETELEDPGFSLYANEIPQTGGGMFPPRGKTQNGCAGTHLYENSWLKKTSSVEYPAPQYSEDSILPHMWMRYWVYDTDQWPTPGEFIGLLCRPMSVPPHVWWFQETSPLLMSGNWFETRFYTSGVVTEIMLEDDLEDPDEIGNRYKIKVHGIEIWVKPMDFFDYAIGDRVSLVKKDKIGSLLTVFTWKSLSEREDQEILYTDIVIIPVSFYLGGN